MMRPHPNACFLLVHHTLDEGRGEQDEGEHHVRGQEGPVQLAHALVLEVRRVRVVLDLHLQYTHTHTGGEGLLYETCCSSNTIITNV